MVDPVGIGIIGAGRIARIHASILSKMPEAKLVAVADIQESIAKDLAKTHNLQYYVDYKDLLNNEEIDAVFICTPSDAHAKPAIEAAEAGKHIFCEKPFATTLKDAESMLKAANKARVKLCIGYMMRFTSPFMQVKKMLSDGVIGDVYFVKSEINCWPMSKWMYEPVNGLVAECHSHVIDLVRWFLGEAQTVYVKGKACLNEWAKENKTMDNATVILEMENGAIVDLFGTATSGNPDGPPYGNVITNLYGKKGTISANLEKQPLTVFLKQTYSKELLEGYNYPDVVFNLGRISLAEHFLDCLIQDEKPLISGEDGKAVLEILLGAKESARLGRVVELPLRPGR